MNMKSSATVWVEPDHVSWPKTSVGDALVG